jgi:RND family efflux transporter MFP subunit
MAHRSIIFASIAAALLATPVMAGDLLIDPIQVIETKALYGRIESRYVVPARAQIGGTLTRLDVTEGTEATAGQVIARISDPKLASQLEAAEARFASAQSQLQNAETELTRNEELLAKGATTSQRVDQVRTTVEVARSAVTEAIAARDVAARQISDGDVLAPAAGRVLGVPGRLGAVVMPGETVATIAGGGVFLRLAIPERHAADLMVGARVQVEKANGQIEKVYPLIEQGRVIVDVAVEGLADTFIGQRMLVRVPVATRTILAVPEGALTRKAGLDMLTLKNGNIEVEITVVPGPVVEGPDGPLREILSGLRTGDMVILP